MRISFAARAPSSAPPFHETLEVDRAVLAEVEWRLVGGVGPVLLVVGRLEDGGGDSGRELPATAAPTSPERRKKSLGEIRRARSTSARVKTRE